LLILLSLIHLARRRKKSDFFSLMLYCGAFIGLGFSFGLTYIEHFILKMYCPYCVASAGLMVFIFICALVGFGIEPAIGFLKSEMFPTSLLKKKS
ncbi:MAG: vitamin K epoxide reductase family protein, partial [bacterium]